MQYILLILFLTGNGQLQHVDSVRFDDDVACEATMKLIRPLQADNMMMYCLPAQGAEHAMR